jgi:hypothetical protein
MDALKKSLTIEAPTKGKKPRKVPPVEGNAVANRGQEACEEECKTRVVNGAAEGRIDGPFKHSAYPDKESRGSAICVPVSRSGRDKNFASLTNYLNLLGLPV